MMNIQQGILNIDFKGVCYFDEASHPEDTSEGSTKYKCALG